MGAVGVFILRRHAQLPGGLVHPLDKGLLAARDIFRHDDAAGAGRGDQDQLEQGVHRHRGPGGQGHRGGIVLGILRFLGVFGANGHQGVQGEVAGLQLLKDKVGRHDLGHGGGDPHGVGILFIEDLAGIVVHDDGGGGSDVRLFRLRSGHSCRTQQQREDQNQDQQAGGTVDFGTGHMAHLLFRRSINRLVLKSVWHIPDTLSNDGKGGNQAVHGIFSAGGKKDGKMPLDMI